MVACGPYLDKAEPSDKKREESRLKTVKIDIMEDLIKTDPLVRVALGMDPDLKGDSIYDLADWMRRRVHNDLFDTKKPLDMSDVNFLFAETLRAMDNIKNMEKWGNKNRWHATLNKLIYLPQEVFRRDMLGGEDLWLATQVLSSRAAGMRSRQGVLVENASKSIELATGVKSRAITKIIGPREERVGKALDAIREMEGTGAGVEELRDARVELKNAEAHLSKAYRGEVGDAKLGEAIKMQRAMVLALEGRYEKEVGGKIQLTNFPIKSVEIDISEEIVELGGKLIGATDKPGDKKMPIIITKKIVDEVALKRVLQEKFGFKKGGEAVGLIDQVRDYLLDFAEIAQLGLNVEKANYVHELTRGKARMSKEEAWDFVNNKLEFNEEDLFFPRRSLGMLHRSARLRNEMNLQHNPVEFLLKNKTIKDDNGLFGHKSTSHMLRRQYDATSNRNSMDLMSVLQGYSNEMISYWHDNKLNLVLNNHMDNLTKAWRQVKDLSGREWFEGYIDGLDDYLKNFAEQSKGRYTGGKLAEISKIITAWKVGLTMGFLNPSTPLLNMAEGQALLLTRVGKHYLFDATKEAHYHKISHIAEKEWTRVAGEEHLQQESRPASMGLIDEHDPMGHYKRTEKDSALLFLQRTRRATTDVAKNLIVLQRKAENVNRQKAFKAGTLMEYEFILQYEHLFRDPGGFKDAQSRLDLNSYGISKVDFDNKQSRALAWDKFVKKRVVKAGYEMVYQTQWNYNMVARHFFEGHPVGKLALMFQHYPLSWVAALRRSYDILNSVRRAGSAEGGGTRRGVQAMFARDTKSKALSMWMNPEMLFALSSGVIAITMGAMRMGTGIVLGQFWQHPGIELVEDTIKYVQNGFKGENEKNKALFWGQGAVNQFTGPFYSDLSDAISLAALKMGIEDGDMPLWLSDVLRGTVGFRPNEVLLTRFGSRKYNNAWDVMYETFLMGGMSVAPKATRLAKSIPGISEKFFGKKAELKDTSYAILRAAGVRDQKGIDKWLIGQLEKDRK